jgi:outer membrane protein insertion porin family
MLFGKGLWFFVVILLCCCAAHAQQQRAPIIAGISVEGLTQGEDMQTVIAYSGLRVGQEARPDELVMAVRNLWNRRTFSDVRVEKERETALGVFLVIKVVPVSRLRNIVISGNDELSETDIRKAIDKRSGDIMSAYDVYLAKLALKKAYAKEGMLYAKIEADVVSADSALAYDLNLTIDEGAEFHVNSIVFEGNTLYTDSELASAFDDTKTKQWWQIWKSSAFDETKYETDKKLLQEWFLNHGLLDAEIISDSVEFDETTRTVNIVLNVVEGSPVHVRNVQFVGNTVYDEYTLAQRLNFERGELYSQKKFQENLNVNQEQSDVASLYADNGYLTSKLTEEFIRVAPDTIDIVIKVLEGDRYTVRYLDIVGNTKTSDRVIRRELFLRPGDFFNRSALIRSIRGLGVLNYFNPETLKPDVVPVDKTKVDVQLKVEERSTDTFNASVGFAGQFGLTGSIGVTLNNFDITAPLSGGAGQIMSFQWEFGQASRLQTFQLSFTEPWLFGHPTTAGFNIYDTRQNFNINMRTTGAQVNIGRRFRWPDDFFRGDWSLSFNRIESNQESLFSRAGINTAITVSQVFSRTSYDSPIFPTSGSRFLFSTRATLGALGIGTTDFGKLGITFEMVNPLLMINNYPRLVLFMSSEMGYVDGFKNDTTIQPNELFYMGGNGLGGFALTPLRGYRDNAVGVLDANGNNLGGRVQARFVAEIRFALSLNPFPIYLLSFAEAGNVWANLRTADPFGLKRAAGVGMRLLLNPIGLLGFDLGYGFDDDPFTRERSGWRFHFQFGR